MKEESELLRRYVKEKSQSAFADLVRRYLGFVYHTALRCLDGDTHAAEEITQAVFTDFARKAPRLVRHQVLAGWLHTSARYAALQYRRGERRRRTYEKEAHAMREDTHDPSVPADWERLRPAIDEALHGLNARDRDAILLRFFEGKTFADMASVLGLTEDGARLRLNRALDKLQPLLARRGITSTAAAVATLLAAQPAGATPPGLAASIAEASWESVATGTRGSESWLALFWTKKSLLALGVLILPLVVASYFLTSSPLAVLIVQQMQSDQEVTLGWVADSVADGVEDYFKASKSALQLKWVRMFSENVHGVDNTIIVLLDLNLREVVALNALYRESRARTQAVFNRAATVTPGADALEIEYRLQWRDFEPFADALDAAIVDVLDWSSAAKYRLLDKSELLYFDGIGGPLREAQRHPIGQMGPYGLPAGLIRVKISWSGSGRNTQYKVNTEGGWGGGGYTGSADAVLQSFYGDLVRKYHPQIESDQILTRVRRL